MFSAGCSRFAVASFSRNSFFRSVTIVGAFSVGFVPVNPHKRPVKFLHAPLRSHQLLPLWRKFPLCPGFLFFARSFAGLFRMVCNTGSRQLCGDEYACSKARALMQCAIASRFPAQSTQCAMLEDFPRARRQRSSFRNSCTHVHVPAPMIAHGYFTQAIFFGVCLMCTACP